MNAVCENLLVEAGGAINVDGKGYAGGTGGYGDGQGPGGGGASGGGIYITCRTFIGNSNALLQAGGVSSGYHKL